ncbi:type II toxin-antitoxin system PemK/MazF family toxin [Polynucleobacter sp. AP-Reno-20A-A9]|uniref:type II toxin-antitoxin system PemK/MazF family toxin n=1 Tax=Polynucleobacter sp. AP-Reno-20A-A9 TaxID=2576925 RepID=UPI001C0D6991|nr:type II toxin-antitoxin system PemK/MazF family toxin [Polynucleobacter sp. AP-Reno-20A-A9]MBU3629337.1 type II toxin-antitoxin system PemK/MazF family toxin [Polynucleobacter sp. AP-Reno-20A-A9]
MSRTWALPAPGDIVWCLFPEVPDSEPGLKPRPAIVLNVEQRDDGNQVSVVYGTSQNLNRLKVGEVAITKMNHPAAYALAGLAYDTKFDFKVIVDLPWSERYFKVPTRSPHGNTPKLGTLHATILRAVEAAYRAACNR